MQLDVAGLRVNDRTALRALQTTARSCAVAATGRLGVPDFADDVAQEVVLHVLTRFLDVYVPGREVDAYFLKVSRYLALGMRRQSSKESHREDVTSLRDAIECDTDSADRQAEQSEIAGRALAAKQILVSRIRARASSARKVAHPPPAVPVAVESPASDKIVVRPLPSGVEPAPVWRKMRDWCALLNIDTAADTAWHNTLAEFIGVHRATVWRWRTGKTQPPKTVVRGIDLLIEEYCRQTQGGRR